MKKVAVISLIFILLLINNLDGHKLIPEIQKNTFKENFFNEKEYKLKLLSLTIVAGTICFANDTKISNSISSLDNKTLDDLSFGFEKLGNITYIFPLQIGTNIIARIYNKPKLTSATNLSIKSTLLSCGIVATTKFLVGRERPYVNNDSKSFKSFSFDEKFYSFPSAHSIFIFTLAASFATEYKDKLWVKILSYSLATGVALQRVYAEKHWASDIIVGAGLGILSVKILEFF